MLPRRRLPLAVVGLLCAGGMLVACDSPPAPAPTPTPAFASDEEAFAAAEEAYRAYNDALNHVDFTMPSTFEPVFALLTGDASSSTRTSFSRFHAEGIQVSGETRFTGFSGVKTHDARHQVEANVCVDVSVVAVTTRDGDSLVQADRPAVQPVLVRFSVQGTGSLRISSFDPLEEYPCA